MKVSIFILALFFCAVFKAFAQDQIVTIKGDTIQCKILKVDEKFIYFQLVKENRPINTSIPLEKVQSHQAIEDYNESSELSYFIRERNVVFGIGLGYGYLINKPIESGNDVIDNHNNKLRHGLVINADVKAKLTEVYGIGLKYSLFYTSVHSNFPIDDPENSTTTIFSATEDVMIHFIGPLFSSSSVIGKSSIIFRSDVSVGGIIFRDYLNAYGNEIKGKGNAIGLACDLGLHFPMKSGTRFNTKVQAIFGRVYDIELFVKDNYQVIDFNEEIGGVSRIELIFGFTF